MPGIDKKRFDTPDETYQLKHGRMDVVRVEGEEIWRSEFTPAWSWDEDFEPYAEGAKSCPMTHREYVVSGRVRYLMDDGSEEVGEPGDFLFIRPGHRAWVLGEESCVLIDW
jgi:mannose-6-phosphate isomerase-like protein (cupin superfamily)